MASGQFQMKSSSSGLEEVGKRCEIRLLQERFNTKSGKSEVVAKDDYNPLEFDPNGAYALVTKQIFDKDNVLTKTVLRINSPQLLRVFKKVVRFYPTIATDFDEPLEMESPFEMLYHHWETLDHYQSASIDDATRMHLSLLLDYMQAEMGKIKDQSERMIKKGFITYNHLWMIFKPGELQYVSKHGHTRLMRLDRTGYEEYKNKGLVLEVYCRYVDYDGTNVGKAKTMVEIRQKHHFAGHKPGRITGLDIFPRKFVVGQEDLEERLTRRGLRFMELLGTQIVQYNGLSQYMKEPPYEYFDVDMEAFPAVWLPKTETGRVIIDQKTFSEEFASEQVEVEVQLSKSDQETLKSIGSPTDGGDEEVTPLLCPPFVYGYSLHFKVWCRFFIDSIEPVRWKPSTDQSLLLPDHQKNVLLALVHSHRFPHEARDQAELKGKGLVILLHGSPGSGKTLTAETAAEVSRRGLLKISLGEIVDGDYIYERKLENFLQYATFWRLIVLIDEADVFLEGRQSGSTNAVNRNAVVATFLYHLEYFQGIIFLTSNRIDVLDPAIKSRIHLALQYSAPDKATRRSLWRQHLLSIPAHERAIDIDSVLELVEATEMNGREISNTLNTARTLARHEAQKLSQRHVETVLRVWTDFDISLQKLEQLRRVKPRSDTLISGARQDSLVLASGAGMVSKWLPPE